MPEIESSLEKNGPVSCSLRVVVPPERVSTAIEAAFKKLGREVRLPGFRKGKVPRKVLEKEYGARLREDVVHDLVEASCAEALKQHQVLIVSNPELVSHELGENSELRFEARLETQPEFDLANYKGLEAVRRIVRIEDRHVDEAVAHLRERMAELEPESDRVNVAEGDVLVVDMAGSCDGQPVPEASGEGVQLEVGAGRFPEEFEKQLVGVTRGIPTPLHVRFPDDHRSPALAGKLLRFEVTVREIKNKLLPRLDDNLPGDAGYDDCETLEDLRAHIRSDLEERAREDATHKMRNALLAAFVDLHSFEVPESLIARQMGSTLREMGISDIPEDKFEEVRSALEPGAIKQVRAGFILDAVAKSEGLEVAEEELVSEVNRQVAGAGAKAEELRSYYSSASAISSLAGSMLRDKALERLVELSTQRDEEVAESEVADSPGSR